MPDSDVVDAEFEEVTGRESAASVAAGPGFFRAVAVDFDGTLTDSGRPAPATLAALDEARDAGRRVVIVTGRILADLLAAFPEAEKHVDLIVAENGAVLASGGRSRALAPAVPDALASALAARGVRCRRGEVLLACDGSDEPVVLALVRRLGLDSQLLRNRGALMVLPAGVSKGSGLAEGLADLGISVHNAVAIGDAENDHALLAAAELGVAVGNAVGALKASADIVLAGSDGQAVASFLRGPVIGGRERVHPQRWRITLGTRDDGTQVSIPASQVNVLITGVPQRGKSYVAGLMAEQLIRLGYSVVVIDPEGDHSGLGRIHDVLVTQAGEPLSPTALARLARQHAGGIVVDLSAASASARADYMPAAQSELEAVRAQTGRPHWLILDEAQVPLARDAGTFFEPATTGYCLVTHRPEDLRPEALLAVDILIALPGGDKADRTTDLIAAAAALPRAAAAALISHAGPGQAVLVDRAHPGTGLVFAIGQRETGHMRHWHKYSGGYLRPDRWFYFRRDQDTATGATAQNAAELQERLESCDEEVLAHHCGHGDFSRWVADVLGDPPLAAALADTERSVRSGAISVAEGRARLTGAVRERYAESGS